MAAALLSAAFLSFAGLVVTLVVGLTAGGEADLLRHTTVGIFSTMLTLLTHSMMMFYLMGKGRAVREAATEGGLSSEFSAEIARRRRPVFSIGTIAMGLTITTAIVGASVDVRVVPPAVHAVLAYAALAANIATLKVEIVALAASARIVDEVNRLLQAEHP